MGLFPAQPGGPPRCCRRAGLVRWHGDADGTLERTTNTPAAPPVEKASSRNWGKKSDGGNGWSGIAFGHPHNTVQLARAGVDIDDHGRAPVPYLVHRYEHRRARAPLPRAAPSLHAAGHTAKIEPRAPYGWDYTMAPPGVVEPSVPRPGSRAYDGGCRGGRGQGAGR